ncbi:MAG: lipid-binding SYLF domain-containing protein [Candidatus Omnitrophota bacterium]
MKNLNVAVATITALIVFNSPVFAATIPTNDEHSQKIRLSAPELDLRLQKASDVLEQMMGSPDQSIPEELLGKCKAVAIYPNVIKGAFIFGARGGTGVIVKRDSATGRWGPVAFSVIGGGNWGLQIGGQSTDLILVVMNDRGLESLTSNSVTLGGDASVAAGPAGRDAAAATDLLLRASILTYSRTWGLFAGLSLDGSIILRDDRSNTTYYGRSVAVSDILDARGVAIAPSSSRLTQLLNEYSQRWSKNPRAMNRDLKPDQKYDFEGQVTALYVAQGEIEVIDLRPLADRPKDRAASMRVRAEPNQLANLKVGDKVRIMFWDRTNEHRAQRIVRF